MWMPGTIILADLAFVEQGMDVDAVDDAVESTEDAEDTATHSNIPGAFDINTANIQFSFVSSYLLSNDPINTATNLEGLQSYTHLYLQLAVLVLLALLNPLTTTLLLLTFTSVAMLHTSTARTQALAYLQLIQQQCEVSDIATFSILSQKRMNMGTKTLLYDTLRRMQDCYAEHASLFKGLVDGDEYTALEAMYARSHVAQPTQSPRQPTQLSQNTHRRTQTWPSPISTIMTPRTSPTITYIQSPVNKAFGELKEGSKRSSKESDREREKEDEQHEQQEDTDKRKSRDSMIEMQSGTVTQINTRQRARTRAQSYMQPLQPLQPPNSVRQRAVSQQHLRLPSTHPAHPRNVSQPAPVLMLNSFGTPIGHISPTPSPAPSRKSSLALADVHKMEEDHKVVDERKEDAGDNVNKKNDAQNTSPTPTNSHTIKPSQVAQRKPKPVLSKTRLWELRQEVHNTRKEVIVAIIALKYTCKADVYWKSVRGVVRDLARSLGKLNNVLQSPINSDGDDRKREMGDSKEKIDKDHSTYTTLRHLEDAYDLLFECYASGQYAEYGDAHAHLSDALRSYASGLDVVSGSGHRKLANDKKRKTNARASGLGIDLQPAEDSNRVEKLQYEDEDGQTRQLADDATDYLLDQTTAASLPRRGNDEVVFDGENVDVGAQASDEDVFAPPDVLDKSSRMAGKEVLDELMGILGNGPGSKVKPPLKTPEAPDTPPQPQWKHNNIPHPHLNSSDDSGDEDSTVQHPHSDPQAAKIAAQKALTSIVF